jgi:hypothetical protein
MPIKLLSDAQRHVGRFRREQFDDFDGGIHPSGGVYARSQLESHLSSSDIAWSEPGDLLQRDHPGPGRRPERC